MLSSILSLSQFCADAEKLKEVGMSQTMKKLIWESNITNVGQWYFSQDELELLPLYIKEGRTEKFKDMCLLNFGDYFLSKGVNYFKLYSKRYGFKNFELFYEELLSLIENISSISFEEEDRNLKLKTLVITTEELINHFAWGLYLSYQAAGVRDDFKIKNITPREIESMKQGLLLSCKIYMVLFYKDSPETSALCQQIKNVFKYGDSYGFISALSGKGTRGTDGSFFRLRFGANELQNIIHAIKVKLFFQSNNLHLDIVTFPFYASISSSAFVYNCLKDIYNNLEGMIHVYSIYEDNVKCGTWDNAKKREIMDTLSHIPGLIRPSHNVQGKNVLIVTHSLAGGKVITGLYNYYKELGAANVYVSAVEAQKDQLDFSEKPLKFKDIDIHISPTFECIGPSPLRHLEKDVLHLAKK